MRAVLRLEWIGEVYDAMERLATMKVYAAGGPTGYFGTTRSKPWVARITGRDPSFGYRRAFERGQIDYLNSNGNGSRGVTLLFTLHPGVYEVHELVSWKRNRRWYCVVAEDATLYEIRKEDVDRWLNEA